MAGIHVLDRVIGLWRRLVLGRRETTDDAAPNSCRPFSRFPQQAARKSSGPSETEPGWGYAEFAVGITPPNATSPSPLDLPPAPTPR
jgi:hypothetical protein